MGYINTVQIDGGIRYLIEPNLYATARGTSEALIAGVTDFELYPGAYVYIKISDVANNATLNVNGTGAKPIYYNNAPIIGDILTSGSIYNFIYNGAQWELVGDITNKNILLGTKAEWQQHYNYVAPEGTILVYTNQGSYVDDNNNTIIVPRIKISDGSTPNIDLPFIGDDIYHEIMNTLNNHINDNIRHITEEERTFWNNKLNCNDTVINNNLVFNRN